MNAIFTTSHLSNQKPIEKRRLFAIAFTEVSINLGIWLIDLLVGITMCTYKTSIVMAKVYMCVCLLLTSRHNRYEILERVHTRRGFDSRQASL